MNGRTAWVCESLSWLATPEAVSHLCYRGSMHDLHTASFVATQPLCSVLSPLKPSKDIQYSKNFAFQLLLSLDALRLKGFHWWQSNFWSVCFDAKNWIQGRGLHILGKNSTVDNPACTPFISVCCFVSFYFWNKALAGNPGYPWTHWTHDLSVCPFWVSDSHQCEWKMALIFTKV